MDHDSIRIHPPLLAGVLLLATLLLQHFLPGLRGFHRHHHLLGALFVIAGVTAMAAAVAIFANHRTTKNPYGQPSTFVSSPPYTTTRNPMYLGFVLLLLGLAIWIGSAVMLLAPIAFYFVIDRMVIPREEATMERLFGETYLEYKARVRRWI
jgi:protein-S-isoprenylcysteine O-methyltransferase Ste14